MEQLSIITESLGEVSALFMSQECKGTEMVMPTTELIRIANQLLLKLNENKND